MASIGHLCASLSVMKIQKKIKCRHILKSTISNHNGSSSHLSVQHTTIIVTYLAKNIISSSGRVLHHEKQNLTVGRSYLLKISFSLEWHFPARNLGKMRFRSFTFNSGRGLVYIWYHMLLSVITIVIHKFCFRDSANLNIIIALHYWDLLYSRHPSKYFTASQKALCPVNWGPEILIKNRAQIKPRQTSSRYHPSKYQVRLEVKNKIQNNNNHKWLPGDFLTISKK